MATLSWDFAPDSLSALDDWCRLMFFERAREDAEKEVAADEKNSLVRWVGSSVDGRA